MFADQVFNIGLEGCLLDRFVQKEDHIGKKVTIKPRGIHQNIYPWPIQLSSRNHLCPCYSACFIPFRLQTHKIKDGALIDPFVSNGLCGPQDNSHLFGILPSLFQASVNDLLSRLFAKVPGLRTGDLIRVKAKKVFSCRYGTRVSYGVITLPRGNISSTKGLDQVCYLS